MAEYIILRQVRLGQGHQPTHKTRHYQGDKMVPAPHTLKIVQYPHDSGYYLLHFDEHDQELTDTFHNSIADAMEQATWEFHIQPSDWQIVVP